MGCLDIPNETVFTMEMTPIKVGVGATDEVAYDLKRLGVRHALIVTDHGVMKLGLPERVRTLLREASISADIFDDVHVEPTDQSFEAINQRTWILLARQRRLQAFARGVVIAGA